MSDWEKWLLRKVQNQAAKGMTSASDVARCPDPDVDCSSLQTDLDQKTTQDQTDWIHESGDQAGKQAARQVGPGSYSLVSRAGEALHEKAHQFQEAAEKLNRAGVAARRSWNSPLWLHVPQKIFAFILGLAVAVGTAIGVHKYLDAPTPTPFTIIAPAVERVEREQEMGRLRRGIMEQDRLFVEILRPQNLLDPVPEPASLAMPIPPAVAVSPVQVSIPHSQVITVPAARVIAQLPTAEAQGQAIDFVERGVNDNRPVRFTVNSSSSSKLPSGFSLTGKELNSTGSFSFSR